MFTTISLFYTIKREYNFGLWELVFISPRFGVMLASMCLSIIFIVVDTCSVLNAFSDALPQGIEPFWKVRIPDVRRLKKLLEYPLPLLHFTFTSSSIHTKIGISSAIFHLQMSLRHSHPGRLQNSPRPNACLLAPKTSQRRDPPNERKYSPLATSWCPASRGYRVWIWWAQDGAK